MSLGPASLRRGRRSLAAARPRPPAGRPTIPTTPPTAPTAAAPPRRRQARAFDRAWLEPFFKPAPASRPSSRSATRTGRRRRPASRAPQVAAARGDERQAARTCSPWRGPTSRSGARPARCSRSCTELPEARPYHAYNAARCRLRRGDAAGALDWAARVPRGRCRRPRPRWSPSTPCAPGRWADAAEAIEDYLDIPGRRAARGGVFKKAEALEKAAARGGARRRAHRAAADVDRRSTGASGRRRRSRPGAIARPSASRPSRRRCPPRRRRW